MLPTKYEKELDKSNTVYDQEQERDNYQFPKRAVEVNIIMMSALRKNHQYYPDRLNTNKKVLKN